MGWSSSAVLVVMATVTAARADAPVKIAAVPDGTIKLAVGEDAGELRRTFRLVPVGVDEVKLAEVRVVDCTDGHGQSCAARIEPGGCAGGCTLTATSAGAATVVVTLPGPGTYISSLEIVYLREDKAPPADGKPPAADPKAPAADGKAPPEPRVVKALVSTALEVTRPAAAIQPMKVTISGATGTSVDLEPGRAGRAIVRVRAQDDDGAPRRLTQVVREPVALKAGSDALFSGATVTLSAVAGDKRVPIGDGAALDLPAAGAVLELEVDGLDQAGKYEGKLRLLAAGRTPQEVSYAITVRDGVGWASLMIAIGVTLSYGVQWWVGKRRARLVQQATLERLRGRLADLGRRDELTDRDRRLVDALVHELDARLDELDDGDALPADVVTLLGRRVELATTLAQASHDVEALPLAARARPRATLDGHALSLADRTADDARLKAVEADLRTLAGTGVRRSALGELLAALDAAVDQARQALPEAQRPRLATEVDPLLAAAHQAADRDQLDELDRQLAAARLALTRIQSAALTVRLPDTPPAMFQDDPPRYQALRDAVQAAVKAIDAAPGPDVAVQLYDDAHARLARAFADATARWCRTHVADHPADDQPAWQALADKAAEARGRPPGEALAILDGVTAEARALEGQLGAMIARGEPERGPLAALAVIPRLARTTLTLPRAAHRLVQIGDLVVLVAVTLIAIASGLKLLWVASPTWGGWNDWLTAILWGAGLHAVGNDKFKGVLGLKKDLAATP